MNALPQFWSAMPEARVLLFTLGISIFTAILFGLAPAFTGARISQVRKVLTTADEGAAGFARGTEGLRKSIEAATPIVTGVGALITGIRALLAH